MGLRARVGHLLDRTAIRIKRLVLGPIVEAHAVDVVDEGLRRRVLGEDQLVAVELDVVVRECRGTWRSRTIETPLTSAPA